jgi:MFS family permease
MSARAPRREAETSSAIPLYRNRDYALLWVGQTLSQIGSQTSWIAYPLLVLALTGSAARAGLVSFANWIPYLLFQLPAGALVDRWDRKRTMLVCDALRALALASIAIAVPLKLVSFEQLVVVAFVERTLSIFFDPAETIALSRIVPTERMAEAVARNDAREYTATLVGPPLGGVLYGISRLAPFAADAASYLVSFISIAALRTRLAPDHRHKRQRLRTEVAEGVRFLWRIPFLRDSLLQAGATNVVWSSLALALIVVTRRHGASGAEIGAMFALLAVGGILGSAASPYLLRRIPPGLLVLGSVWWWGVVVALLVLTTNPFLLGAGAGAAIFLAPAWNGTVVGLRIRLTPDRLQGRVQAVDALLSYGVRPFGLLLTGYLLDWIGGRATIATIGLWALLAAAASTLSPALRHPPIHDPAHAQ